MIFFPLALTTKYHRQKCTHLLKKTKRKLCGLYSKQASSAMTLYLLHKTSQIEGIIDYLILKFHVKCYSVLEPDTLLDKKHNKMSKSFKGPTEVSFSLHKQCEIQRESVRYTKGLDVKHLGFLTGVMLGEQT